MTEQPSNHQKLEYTHATLCFPMRDGQVLLGVKQKKIGAGLLNGAGGKQEVGDPDIHYTNLRETEEEFGIRLINPTKVGEIRFHNPSDDDSLKKMLVHIFTATQWQGQPHDTDEMKNVGWHQIEGFDYERLIPGDQLFLPQILGGKCVRGLIIYNHDWSVQTCQMEEVTGF